MILMSKKMMSQNKLYEIKSVPYNKTLPHPSSILNVYKVFEYIDMLSICIW